MGKSMRPGAKQQQRKASKQKKKRVLCGASPSMEAKKQEEEVMATSLAVTDEDPFDSKRLLAWVAETNTFLVQAAKTKNEQIANWKLDLDEKNNELAKKNKLIANWRLDLDKKNGELDEKNDELPRMSEALTKRMNAYDQRARAVAAIRIYAAIGYYLKRTLAISMLHDFSVGTCSSDPSVTSSFASALQQANSVLTLGDLNAMEDEMWNERHSMVHGRLPDASKFLKAIDCVQLSDHLKNKLRGLIHLLYGES